MNLLRLQSVCALGMYVLSSCAPQERSSPPVGLLEDQLNHDIEVIAPRGWNTFELGAPITLEIRNASDGDVVFDSDFGVLIFEKQQNEWLQVEDRLTSPNTDEIVLPPMKDSPMESRAVSVLPAISGDRISYLRVYVRGMSVTSNPQDSGSVGAYVDIILSP